MRNTTFFICTLCLMLFCNGCAVVGGTTSREPVATSTVFTQQSQVRAVLDQLSDACQSKRLSEFMSLVAEDFAGDKMILESSIRHDFSSFNNVAIRYTINNITPDIKGDKVFLAITFTRSHQVVKTGKMSTVNGMTELVLKNEAGQYRLYSMKKPLVFGLSE